MFAPSPPLTLGAVFIPEACPMTMFVALNQRGHLTTIESVYRGIACNCTCVSCGEPVVAKKGPVRGHHFSHRSRKVSCQIQRESLLHLYAKEVICDALGLQLPTMPGVSPSSEDTTSWWDFTTVNREVPQPGFQPDLVAQFKDGSRLFIEIAVTSFIDEVKLERIRATDTPTVEIDLRALMLGSSPIPSEAAKSYILHQTSHKAWIHPETPQAPQAPQPIMAQRPDLTSRIDLASPKPMPLLPERRFTILHMWVSAKTLPSGSVAVRSWSYNPQVTELLKSWRNQMGGEYNPKYKSWIFYPQNREEILARLQAMDQAGPAESQATMLCTERRDVH